MTSTINIYSSGKPTDLNIALALLKASESFTPHTAKDIARLAVTDDRVDSTAKSIGQQFSRIGETPSLRLNRSKPNAYSQRQIQSLLQTRPKTLARGRFAQTIVKWLYWYIHNPQQVASVSDANPAVIYERINRLVYERDLNDLCIGLDPDYPMETELSVEIVSLPTARKLQLLHLLEPEEDCGWEDGEPVGVDEAPPPRPRRSKESPSRDLKPEKEAIVIRFPRRIATPILVAALAIPLAVAAVKYIPTSLDYILALRTHGPNDAVNLNPGNDIDSIYGRAWALTQAGDYGEAESLCFQMLSLDENPFWQARAFGILGRIQIDQNKNSAIHWIDLAIDLFAKNPKEKLGLMNVYSYNLFYVLWLDALHDGNIEKALEYGYKRLSLYGDSKNLSPYIFLDLAFTHAFDRSSHSSSYYLNKAEGNLKTWGKPRDMAALAIAEIAIGRISGQPVQEKIRQVQTYIEESGQTDFMFFLDMAKGRHHTGGGGGAGG